MSNLAAGVVISNTHRSVLAYLNYSVVSLKSIVQYAAHDFSVEEREEAIRVKLHVEGNVVVVHCVMNCDALIMVCGWTLQRRDIA